MVKTGTHLELTRQTKDETRDKKKQTDTDGIRTRDLCYGNTALPNSEPTKHTALPSRPLKRVDQAVGVSWIS